MKIIKYKYLIILLFVFSLSSCEDLIDVEVKSYINGQVFWQVEGDFEPYLFGIYSTYRGNIDYMGFGEDRSEMWVQGYSDRFSNAWSQVLTDENTVQWTSYYGTISHVNLLLNNIEHFEFTSTSTKSKIKAEAHAIRAAMYFFLARVWGDVPLALEAVEDHNTPLLPRSPVGDVFQQINNDIEQSLTLFPDDGYTDRYRWTKPAVYALLADVKMWSATVLGGGEVDFNAAIDAITEVENSDVSLMSEYGNVFDIPRNNEIIFSFYLDRTEYVSGQYNNSILRFDRSGGADNVNDLPISLNGQAGYTLSSKAIDLFKSFPEDRRIERTYIPELYDGEVANYWPNKLIGTQYSDARIADSDIILYRLSDLLLLKAEAYAALNQIEDALQYLNKIRNRAGIPDYTNTSLLQKEILDERGRELFHEIKRWYDLRRAHALGTIDIYEYIPNLQGKTTPLYWPVHVNMLARNNRLVQTEGY